jgi:hypothetical protein
LNEAENVMVAVICRSADVSWGNYQNVYDTIYDLLILRWDKASGALCLYASDYQALRSDRMAEAVTNNKTKLVSGTPIFNILNNVELPLVKSLGSSRIGAISFTSYFGPNVTEGLASIEKAESSLNNIACLGYENGDRVLWGGTQRRGKIWQHKSGTISEWINWTATTWAKVTSEDQLESNIAKDFLRPERMLKPHGSYPLSVQWGEQAQMRLNDRQFVVLGSTAYPLFMVDLAIDSVAADGSIVIGITNINCRFQKACRAATAKSMSKARSCALTEEPMSRSPSRSICKKTRSSFAMLTVLTPTTATIYLRISTREPSTRPSLKRGTGAAFHLIRSQCTKPLIGRPFSTVLMKICEMTSILFSTTTAAARPPTSFVSRMGTKARFISASFIATVHMMAACPKISATSTPYAAKRKRASRPSMPACRGCITILSAAMKHGRAKAPRGS